MNVELIKMDKSVAQAKLTAYRKAIATRHHGVGAMKPGTFVEVDTAPRQMVVDELVRRGVRPNSGLAMQAEQALLNRGSFNEVDTARDMRYRFKPEVEALSHHQRPWIALGLLNAAPRCDACDVPMFGGCHAVGFLKVCADYCKGGCEWRVF